MYAVMYIADYHIESSIEDDDAKIDTMIKITVWTCCTCVNITTDIVTLHRREVDRDDHPKKCNIHGF